MRMQRGRQFDQGNPPWLHCMSRCVRRAMLCGEGFEHRRRWIENRLRLLGRCFAVQVGAYAVMSNHLHVVLRPRPQGVAAWSPQEVARAWWCVRYDWDPQEGDAQGRPDPVQIEQLAQDEVFIGLWRQRLASVSWFMKALKEPLSRSANREDGVRGAFWEGRFTSVPLLDQSAVVACMVYVDLNPIRAGIAQTPETSAHTSVAERIHGLRQKWLCPVEEATAGAVGQPGWRLHEYLQLVDASGRSIIGGKRGYIAEDLPSLSERLGCSPERWLATVGAVGGMRGTALGQGMALAQEAARRGMQYVQTRCRLFARNSARAGPN